MARTGEGPLAPRILDGRVAALTYTVDQIANGSRGLLDEVATGKVTGEEEHWSRTDLWDFQANVDGARVAFEDVEPLVEKNDPELAQQIRTRFDDLQPAGPAPQERGFRDVQRPDHRTVARVGRWSRG